MSKTPVVGMVGLFLVGIAATGCDSGRPNSKYRPPSAFGNSTAKDAPAVSSKETPSTAVVGNPPSDRSVTPLAPTPPARLADGNATPPGGLGGGPLGTTTGFGSTAASPTTRSQEVARPLGSGPSMGLGSSGLGSDGLGSRVPTKDQSLSVNRQGLGALPPPPPMRGGETTPLSGLPTVPSPVLGGNAPSGATLPPVSGNSTTSSSTSLLPTTTTTTTTTLPPPPPVSNPGGGALSPPAPQSWGTGSR